MTRLEELNIAILRSNGLNKLADKMELASRILENKHKYIKAS